MNNNSSLYYGWLVFLAVILLIGIFTAAKIFVQGHGLFNADDVILWSLPLGVYVFLALTSSGLALLSSLPLVFRVERYDPLAKRLVFLSLATLAGAFVAIGLELGSVFHMIYLLLSPNVTSPIWWMGTIYTVELVLLTVKFRRLHTGRESGPVDKAFALVSFLCAMAAPMMIGAVFGITEHRAVYLGPFLPVYYLLMALLSGTALFVFYNLVLNGVMKKPLSPGWSALNEDFANLFSWMLGVVAAVTFVRFLYEAAVSFPAFSTYQRFGHAFGTMGVFHIEVLLGLFLPFILMAAPRWRTTISARTWASGLTLAGALAMHMEILIAGQALPVGPKAEQFPDFICYLPSVWEWLVALFALGVMMGGYTLGEKYLNLEPDQA